MSSLHIPEVCGAMLLPDCTLFPHGGLPLHIFEPRYRQMLEDTLSDSCFFAVARLTGAETKEPGKCTAPIGTVGLVRASREMEDGSSNLLLHGVIRVRFTEWIDDAPYPKARISPLPAVFEPESQAESATEALREAAEAATLELPEEVRQTVLDMSRQIDDPAILADVICQQFLHQPDDRQQMLETESVAERIAWICRELAP
ncbi:LON peptidase substrate-binding domain-containing protein [Haloferula sp.]|uniref:LON peptidase substrate-binding domain-containing protein n=1 Tax=Haloferula sp. TaxID=2497595 RepID=UPI003C78D6FE